MKNGLDKFFAFYSLPLLVVAVACLQIYKTETTNLSRWKGGGFGMYTNINEVYNIIVINDSLFSKNHFKTKDAGERQRVKSNLLFNPNNENTKKFIETLKNRNQIEKIQIYRPVLNPTNNQLRYELSYEKLFD